MIKRILAAGIMTFAAITMSAGAEYNENETAKLSYTRDGNSVTVSVNGTLNNKSDGASDIIVAIYSDARLLNTRILSFDENVSNMGVGDFTITLPEDTDTVSVRAFYWSADGSCTPYENSYTVSDVPGNAYEVYGRVVANAKGSAYGLYPDEVKFDVERSDLFYGEISISPENRNVLYDEIFRVGSTDIADHMFEYVRAWIAHDDASDEFTVVKYESAAENETVSFPAAELADDDTSIGTRYIENGKLPVYIADNSSATRKYDLADDVRMYVNGVRLGNVSDDLITEYILNNPGGSVTLVDKTAVGSASNDGKYDYIMVDYYVNAVVSSVKKTSSKNVISFISSDTGAQKMEWDPSDKDINIAFYKDGKKISVDEVNRYDSLAIKYDIVDMGTGSNSLTDTEYYEVYVSSDTATGKVESRDTDRNTAVINGTEYYFIPTMSNVTELSIGRTYTVFLNAFGNAIYSVSGTAVIPTLAPSEATSAPEEPFAFNGASPFLYIQSVNGTNTLNGTISLNTSGQAKPLTAEILFYENGSEKAVKTIPLAAGSSSFSFNARALDHSGTPERAALRIMDGDTELYRDDIAITDAEKLYKVRGRVTSTSRNGDVRKGEVMFFIELADEFDGNYNIRKSNENLMYATIGTGDTNAEELLFIYSDAVIAKENGKYTFVLISPASDGQTVSFSCNDVADDAENIGINYINGKVNPKLPVYKSATTSSTTKYDLATDPAAVLYVNGVNAGTADDDMINEYILNNDTGTVTLIDKTDVGSTSTDGKYDYIMVDYYVDAVVDYTVATSSKARIYFKQAQLRAMKMEWDPDDPDVDITFIKDDREIDYTELAENDVLSIQYDIVNEGAGSDSLTNKDYYKVFVSSNKITGTVTSKDEEDQTITIGGNAYDLNESMTSTSDFALGDEYDVYISIFGQIAYFDESSSAKNYGVIVGMYQESGKDYPAVRLVTSDGEIVAYECKDESEARKFYNYAISGNIYGYDSHWQFFSKTSTSVGYDNVNVRERIKSGETVCTYKLSNGKIMFDRAMGALGGTELTFKESSSKLGGYTVNDAVTRIVDMDDYMNESNPGNTVSTLSVADLEDDADYEAYLFDKNANGVYRFAIVLKGTSTIRPETQIAVVKKSNGMKYVDSTTCNSYTVLRGGNEEELLYEDDWSYLAEGTVIAYMTGSEGYVEDGDLYVLYNPDGDYDSLLANVTANDDFGAGLQNVKKITASGKNNGKYEIAYNGATSTSKDVYAYLGVVHKKTDTSFELFTSRSDGRSAVADVADLAIDSKTNIYSYDYSKRVNAGARLTNGSSPVQYATIFDNAYTDDNNTVVWDNVYEYGIKPQLAFVKEIDGRVTDVIFFIPPDYYEGYEPVEIEVNDTDYAVIIGMYKQPGKAQPTVYLVTSDAEVTGYECMDSAEADRFYQYATGESGSFKAFDRSDIADRIRNGETVCTYRLEDDRIILDQEFTGVGGYELTYKASSRRIGSYQIGDQTKIIDIDAFLNNDSANVRALSPDDFEDDADYTAYLFDKSMSGIYRFAIVSGGTSSVRPETQIAVVKKAEGEKDADTVTCSAYTVFKDGQEVEILYEDTNSDIPEGSVIAYAISPDGYINDGDLYVLYNPDGDYKALLANVTGTDDFGAGLKNVQKITSGKDEGKYEIAYNGTTSSSKDVYAYLGVVYRKSASSFELFTNKINGATSINDTTDFSIAGANVYTFDYNERVNKGVRLSVGNSGTQNTSIFNQAYSDPSGTVTLDSLRDKNYVTWDMSVLYANDITPQLAFVREVDGEATDVVFYVAP